MLSSARSPVLDLELVVGAGFVPVQPLASGASIFRGRTTTLSGDPREEEMSVQRAVDFIAKNTRRFVENRFTGELITSNLLEAIEIETNKFLDTHTDKIESGSVSTIGVDPQEPRQVNLSIDITPLFPINSIGLTVNVVVTI